MSVQDIHVYIVVAMWRQRTFDDTFCKDCQCIEGLHGNMSCNQIFDVAATQTH